MDDDDQAGANQAGDEQVADDQVVMEMRNVAQAIAWQADHAAKNSAPATGRVITAFLPLLEGKTQCGARMRTWPGLTLEDAMPLRLTGGLHHLLLSGDDTRLAPVYAGAVTDQAEIDALVLAMVQDHDARLLGWFEGPPQTNEGGRSSGIMAGLLWLAQRLGPRFELNEIGSSAGINTMMERFAFDLGGVSAGAGGSPMRIAPLWRGPPPPPGPVEIDAIQGCDLAPIDLTDKAAALRLKSYVWPDTPVRLQRIDTAIALAAENPPQVARADAAKWVSARLVAEQTQGTTRALFHSIVWQYLPPKSRAQIDADMAAVGARASSDKPLAWVQVETNRQTFRHEIRARFWPGGEGWTLLGEAHAHGAWIDWYGV